MITDSIVLSTVWLDQPGLGDRPARTLLVGGAIFSIRHRFGSLAFDLQADSTTVTDDPAATLRWLGERLPAEPARLLLWRGEDIVVPSLIAAAETARDTLAAARLLRALDRAFDGEVVDVALPHGGANATSFDAIAHQHRLPFVAMSRSDLAQAHRTGCHGAIREHLAARAKATWQLWLHGGEDTETFRSMTKAWLASPEAGLRL